MTRSGPLAAIDCGTNAVRLLVADLSDDGILAERCRLMRIVRLGEGVDRTGEFSSAALDRTFSALMEYADVMGEQQVSQLRFVATSATRDVQNRAAFVDGVRAILGIEPEVISGEEEANLSFSGAVRGLPLGLVAAPVLVVDIGGGSTEFVLGSSVPEFSASVDVGCVRLTERHLTADPPTPEQIRATAADLDEAISRAARIVPFDRARSFVGLAGTVTTVAAMALDLDRYDPQVLHGAVIGREQVDRVTERLLAMTRAERASLPFMHPGRVDVIGGGAMALRAVMKAGGFSSVIVSESDILDGIVYRIGAF